MNLSEFNINHFYELVTGKINQWVETGISMLPNLVVAVLILLLFVLLAKVTRKLTQNLLQRITDNLSLQALLANVLYFSVLAIGTFIALSVLNLDGAVTSLLAGAGVIGLALGFAFQDIAANFMAGTLMSFRKPFNEGDLLKTNDIFGVVQKIHLRTTEIATLDGLTVLIPNSQVFKNPIINYTDQGRRRVDLTVGVHYSTDLPLAKKVARDAVAGLEGIDPEQVSIFYTEFGDSSINFTIRLWIPFTNRQADYWDASDRSVIAIKKAFDEHSITIPFPIRTLELGQVDFKGIFGEYQQHHRGSAEE